MPRRDASFEELEAELAIDRVSLDDAILHQAEIYYEVAKQLALSVSRVDETKQRYKEVEAEAAERIREDAERADVKITETAITRMLPAETDVKQARQNVIDLERQVGLLEALEKSFRQRNDALERLLRLHMSQYYDPINLDRAARPLRVAEGEVIRRERANRRDRNHERDR